MQNVIIRNIPAFKFRTNEEIKRLRTNVQLCGDDIKAIALTSCLPDDGKTTVSFNLAISLSELGKDVLYVNCDLRNTSSLLEKYRIVGAKNGMTQYLAGLIPYDDAIGKTSISHLYIAVAGSVAPNPAELLSSQRFVEFIKQAKEQFSYVIVDTPPLGTVVDASIVARECDGSIMVVPAKTHSYRLVREIIEDLKATGTKFLGVILNKVNLMDKQSYGYYGKYYGKHYGKYYGKYYGDYYGDEEFPTKQDKKKKR